MQSLNGGALIYKLESDKWIKNGKMQEDKRLIFKDPLGVVLKNQIRRWRNVDEIPSISTNDAPEKGLVSGIKTHSKAIHILCTILSFITLRMVNRSVKVILENKEIFLNVRSYEKWRKINHEALNAIGVIKKGRKCKQIPRIKKEIQTLAKFLAFDEKKRWPIKKTTASANDRFELAACALDLANQKVNSVKGVGFRASDPKWEEVKFQLAAYYILVTSRVEHDCSGDLLKVGNGIIVRDQSIRPEVIDRLRFRDKKGLEKELEFFEKEGNEKRIKKLKEDIEIFNRIQIIFEKTDGTILPYFEHVINKVPDTFSSLQTRSNPVQAKKLLVVLAKKNGDEPLRITDEIIQHNLKGTKPLDPLQKELLEHLKSMGKALKEQFDSKDPNPVIVPLLQKSFLEIANHITEDNQYDDSLAWRIGTLTAWKLLEEATSELKDDGTTIIQCEAEEDKRLILKFPPSNFYQDPELKIPFNPPYITPLSGKFEDEAGPDCAYEVVKIVNDRIALNSEEQILLGELIKRRAYTTWENHDKAVQEATEKLRTELMQADPPKPILKAYLEHRKNRLLDDYGINDDDMPPIYPEDSFLHLVKLCERIEKVGSLIGYRYYLKGCLMDFTAKLDFGQDGKVQVPAELLIEQGKISPTQEEHDALIGKYFPGKKIPIYPPREAPKVDKGNDRLQGVGEKDLVQMLFHIPKNNGMRGNCCVGALAQAIFGNYDPVSGDCLGPDYSGNHNALVAIRSAAARYMRDHVEEFIELVPKDKATHKAKVDWILARAKKIELIDHGEWFEDTEIKAISSIVQRPISICVDDNIRLDKNGSIGKIVHNAHLDTEPLYLYLQESHFDCLIPKREGTKPILRKVLN